MIEILRVKKTMPIDPDTTFDADSRRWALSTLAMSETLEPVDDARLLRFISSEEYVLDLARVEAVEVAANRVQAADRIARLGGQQRLEATVEAFAQRFFEMVPAERTKRWQSLKKKCSNIPSLNGWLDDLAGGLEVETPATPPEPTLKLLIENCQTVFVAKSPAKIRIRQQFFETLSEDLASWLIVVRQLRARHPEFVEHVGDWLDGLSQVSAQDKQAERTLRAVRQYEARGARSQAGSEKSSSSNHWWVICAVILGVLRLVSSLSRHATSYSGSGSGSPPPPVQFQQPISPPAGNPAPQPWKYQPPRQPQPQPGPPRWGNGGRPSMPSRPSVPSPQPFQPGRR